MKYATWSFPFTTLFRTFYVCFARYQERMVWSPYRPELHLLEMVHWSSIMAVFPEPYCARVGFVLSPFLMPLCCPSGFQSDLSLSSQDCVSFSKKERAQGNETVIDELMSSLVSFVIRCFCTISVVELWTACSHELKKKLTLFASQITVDRHRFQSVDSHCRKYSQEWNCAPRGIWKRTSPLGSAVLPGTALSEIACPC